jgi:hypothetical protein
VLTGVWFFAFAQLVKKFVSQLDSVCSTKRIGCQDATNVVRVGSDLKDLTKVADNSIVVVTEEGMRRRFAKAGQLDVGESLRCSGGLFPHSARVEPEVFALRVTGFDMAFFRICASALVYNELNLPVRIHW